MAITPVGEIWGIGRKLTTRLEAQGINSVADLVAVDGKTYGIVMGSLLSEPC